MIIIENILVSDEVVEEQFVCNLDACKGACCWEGDSGAPLEAGEVALLEEIYDKVAPFLSPAGKQAIAEQGTAVWYPEEEEWGTPLVAKGPCAYLVMEGGVAQCGIEKAHQAGAIDFKKPISCHLYPIRVVKNEEKNFEALNYHRWDICSAACEKGRAEQVPVYRFLREAIVRKYGEEFYQVLEAAAQVK